MGDAVEESPNSLRSRSTARVLDLLSEGPIKGLVTDKKGIYVNEVAWETSSGELNFDGLTAELRYGDSSQSEIAGFPAIEREIGSGQPIKFGNLAGESALTPEIQINDSLVDAVRVTIQVPALVATGRKTGDIFGTSVAIKIEVKNAATSYTTYLTDTISGKTTSPYERSYRIPLPKDAALFDLGAPFKIRVSRTTIDSEDSFNQNATSLSHYTEIIDHKLSYPDTAYIGMTFDSQLFKSGIPNRQYLIDGLKMSVPSNYFPAGMTIENLIGPSEDYTGTLWGKDDILTPNPANNVTAPDGTTSAQAIIPNSTLDGHALALSSPLSGLYPGIDYTASVYVKRLSPLCNGVRFEVYGNVAAGSPNSWVSYCVDLNFDTGVATYVDYSLAYHGGRNVGWGCEPVGNGWYRLWLAGFPNGTNPAIRPAVWMNYGNTRTFAGDNTTPYVAIWGFQVHPGKTPYQYLKNTTAAKVTGTSAARYYYGNWDGTFKIEWTNNPAWVLYLLLTHPRIGMGQWVTENLVDKWSLYNLAKYCDELVPDGFGGYEPRFTFNGVIRNRDEAYNVIQNIATVFRGIVYWGAGSTLISWDAPKDASILVTPANVIDGMFDYKGVGWKARHSAVLVKWNDPNNLFKDAVEVVEDQDLIQRFGWKPLDTTALGCTSRGQAYRWGKWILYTEKFETETVVYKASFDHMIKDGTAVMPGDIIKIMDPSYAGVRNGGRIVGVTSNRLTHGSALNLWTTYGASVTANALTRENIVFDQVFESADVDTEHLIYQNYEPAASFLEEDQVYNFSAYLTRPETNSVNKVWLYISYPPSWSEYSLVTLDMSTGATDILLSNPARISNISAELVGGSGQSAVWRLSFDFIAKPGANAYAQVRFQALSDSGNSLYTGNPARSFYAAQAQISPGSGVIDYIDTGSTRRQAVILDNPVTLLSHVPYKLSVTLPSGKVEDRLVITPAGNRSVLAVDTGFSEEPVQNAMWILSSAEVEPRLFRVLSVREQEKNIVEVTALYHNPDKFAMVEYEMEFEEPNFSVLNLGSLKPPSGLSVNEYLFLSVSNTPQSAATLSWTPPASESRAMSYEIHWKEPGEDWKFYRTIADVSITIDNVKQGLYSFRVRTLSPLGTASTWQLLENVQFFGITKKPAGITNFNMNAVGDQAYLTWTAVSDPTIARFVIKMQNVVTGALWGSGIVVLDNISANASHVYVPLRFGTYMIKPVSIADVESDATAMVISDVAGINNFNATETITAEPAFNGTKTNCGVTSGALVTTATGGLYPAEAIYQLSNVIDLGEVYTNRITPTITAAGQRASYTLNTWGFLAQVEALDGGVGNSWSVAIEYATTRVAPATATAADWSEWKPLIVSDSTARGYRFRIRLLSYDTSVQVRVGAFNIIIDMPDRVEGQQGVTVPSTTAGLNVLYTNAFKAVPAVAVTIQNAAANDVATLSNESRTGFTVNITNGGTPVSRAINWVAKGYGKQ